MLGLKVKFRKSGNSKVVSIPKAIQDLLGWREGDMLNIQLHGNEIRVSKRRKVN